MGPCTATISRTTQLWLTTLAPQVAVTRLDLWLITPVMQVVNTPRPAVMSPRHSWKPLSYAAYRGLLTPHHSYKLLSYATWNGGLQPHYNSTASHYCTLIRVLAREPSSSTTGTTIVRCVELWLTAMQMTQGYLRLGTRARKPVSPENSQTMPTGACCPTRSRCREDLPV